MNRKEMKKRAKSVLKKHYWIFLVLCIFAGIAGVNYSDALDFVKLPSTVKSQLLNDGETENADTSGNTTVRTVGMSLDTVYGSLLNGNEKQVEENSKELEKQAEKSEDKDYGVVQVGRKGGVLAFVVNKVSSGSLYVTIYAAIKSIVGSSGAATVIFILFSTLFITAVWLLIHNYITVIIKRIYLEGRTYDEIPFSRMMFLVRVHKVLKTVWTLTLEMIYYFLWSLTVVGAFVKRYSYFMVPYIAAENPGISAKKAITLSRQMMKGHKWECFKLEFSFIGWSLLSTFTFGLSGLFFSNPYQEAVFGEYYSFIRKLAKENSIPDSDLLNDTYLFEKASEEMIRKVYNDIPQDQNFSTEEIEKSRGKIGGFISRNFGIILRYDKKEEEYRNLSLMEMKYNVYRSILKGSSYPGRLYPVPESEKKRKNAQSLLYLRHYSVVSLIMMFFSFSLIGWIWEVSLHLISDGTFVNRGVLHGPWLPIYGTGGILILILLTRMRKKPWLEFICGVLLAGIVEYFTAWNLETTHGGQKWWDYSGYFLNLHGRICAEGLLVFGLGGLAVVYFAAPLLDNLFRKISSKIIIPLCIVLLVLFTADQAYSKSNPNTGDGITNYTTETSSDTSGNSK
ncbi:MAG: DUF975 family protein [Clostridia bacterium]|nr:DUF975 family protein [Clostridia bacterium]MDY5555475.1 DUF975 family protein [Blautia sp.]